MCKALGSLSFSHIHMSYLTYFCTKLNFKYQKYQVCLTLQANMHRSLAFSFLPFIHLSIHLYCMPFTISNFYFNFSIVPVRGRLEDIGKSLHSKVKRFIEYKPIVTFLSPLLIIHQVPFERSCTTRRPLCPIVVFHLDQNMIINDHCHQ